MKLLGLVLLGLCFAAPASAETLTLTWDKVNDIPGAVVQEYNLYTCIEQTFSGPDCKIPIATILHPTTTYTIENPGQGFAVVTAVDTDSNESEPSNMINNIFPGKVLNFRFVVEGTVTIE